MPNIPSPSKLPKGVIALIVIGVCAIWWFYPTFIKWVVTTNEYENTGVQGDTYGGLNALFSSLSLLCLIVAVWYQKHQLEIEKERHAIDMLNADKKEKMDKVSVYIDNIFASKSSVVILNKSGSFALSRVVPDIISDVAKHKHHFIHNTQYTANNNALLNEKGYEKVREQLDFVFNQISVSDYLYKHLIILRYIANFKTENGTVDEYKRIHNIQNEAIQLYLASLTATDLNMLSLSIYLPEFKALLNKLNMGDILLSHISDADIKHVLNECLHS